MTLALDACAKAGDLRESHGGISGEAGRSAVCNAVRERAQVDQNYFMGRMHASVARAGDSADSIAKLVHYELAGRYSVAALAAGQAKPGSLPALGSRQDVRPAHPAPEPE